MCNIIIHPNFSFFPSTGFSIEKQIINNKQICCHHINIYQIILFGVKLTPLNEYQWRKSMGMPMHMCVLLIKF
jgi:hypothetical protein